VSRALPDRVARHFPGDPPAEPHPWVARELYADEELLWQGHPHRWGFVTATPFLVAAVFVLGYLYITVGDSGVGLRDGVFLLFREMAPWVFPLLGVLLLGVLYFAFRDPRARWLYAVTDERMMTFHQGERVREVGPRELGRLQVVAGREMRLRGLGDVLWHYNPKNNRSDPSNAGPDRGRWGFRGMPEPEKVKDGMLAWAEAVRADVDAAGRGVADTSAPTPGASPEDPEAVAPAGIDVPNREHGFALTVPPDWRGTVGREKKRELVLLGVDTGIRSADLEEETSIEAPIDDWTVLQVRGRSGAELDLRIQLGPLEAEGSDPFGSLLAMGLGEPDPSEPELEQGPFSGFSQTYRRPGFALRHVYLDGDDVHLVIVGKVGSGSARARADQLAEIDAIVRSIRAIGGP